MPADFSSPSPKPATCSVCGASFHYVPMIVGGVEIGGPPFRCDRCEGEYLAKIEAEELEERRRAAAAGRARRLEAWRTRICPPRLLATDLQHPTLQAENLQRALAWQYGPKGLLLHGVTGTGKTRTLYLLCERLFVEEGRTIEIFPACDFAFQLAKAYHDGADYRFIERCRTVEVLALDDLGKEKMTDRVQSDLFGIIDWRINYHRPILVTTNCDGDAFASRFPDPETAVPLIERLRGSCICMDILMTAPRRSRRA